MARTVDTGNPLWVAESPFVTLEHIAPHLTLMCHVRDTSSGAIHGAVAQWVAIGEGQSALTNGRRYCVGVVDINYTLEVITVATPAALP